MAAGGFRRSRPWLATLTAFLIVLSAFTGLQPVAVASSPDIVISQIYGGGGNSGAVLRNDYVELFNRGTESVNLAGWSLQYTSAAGTSWGNQKLTFTDGTIQPGGYYLVQLASAGSNGSPLPVLPDATGGFNMSATTGKIALVRNSDSLPAVTCPDDPDIADLLGYGASANCGEGGTKAPAPSATMAIFRAGNGCTDTDSNAADFAAGAPAPRNSGSAPNPCGGGGPTDTPPSVAATVPAANATGVPANGGISVTFSEPVTLAEGWLMLTCATTGLHGYTVAGGPATYAVTPLAPFGYSETCTATVAPALVTDQDGDPDPMDHSHLWLFTTEAPPAPAVRIREIQGAGHASPLNGQTLSGIAGVVTAVKSNGFYMQDPEPDLDPATSEAIFVYRPNRTVSVGDAVTVNGRVEEYLPGGDTSSLTITQLTGTPAVTVLSSGNPLPAATIIGQGGYMAPGAVIDNDSFALFDPAEDGIDFWESLESMLVTLPEPVAVGPTNRYGEIPIVPEGATLRTNRGGVIARGDDFNPERILLDDALSATPEVNVGDRFGAITGVVDYSVKNFKLQALSPVAAVPGGLTREVTAPAGNGQLSIATFNVENLDPGDSDAKFAGLADLIVQNLQAPDLIAVEEIQDNNGPTNDSVVDASQTFARLIAAIAAAGGPTYDWRAVNPADDQDGGEPGGNIRVGFLFRTDRGISFVDRPGGTATAATSVATGAEGVQLSYSPGRIDPTNPAFANSRKPLAGEFLYGGARLFVIANHFNSKGGDQALFGSAQPPVRSSETQRHQQAQAVGAFVGEILAADPNANVVVLGDLNDFDFAQTLTILKSYGLYNPMESLEAGERYTYVFEGNSQALDHLLLSQNLFQNTPWTYDIVHVNSEFGDQISDHDPQVIRLSLNQAPTVSAGGPYTVGEGGEVTLTATGSDADGDALTFAWDLDGDGSFEKEGQSVRFDALAIDGPASRTVTVKVTDPAGKAATAQATVTVANVAPAASLALTPSGPVDQGSPVTLTLSGAADPGRVDAAEGFDYGFACTAEGPLTWGTSPSAACTFAVTGVYPVRAAIRDKDGGATEYSDTVTVQNVAPTVGRVELSSSLARPGETITASATITDPGAQDSFTATWDWGDATSSEGAVQNGTVTGSHVYANPGIYTVRVTVTDNAGGVAASLSEPLVVYGPESASFSGGGWIEAGDGQKANLAVTVRYKEGAPTGQMTFDARNLKFRATSYDWLVAAGNTAWLQGSGTVQGSGEYGFLLVVVHDESGSRVRVRVWAKATGAVLFDSQPDAALTAAPTAPLEGGSLQIRVK